MPFDRKKADEAANNLSLVADQLDDANLSQLAMIAHGLMDRLEAVLEGDSPIAGDDQ